MSGLARRQGRLSRKQEEERRLLLNKRRWEGIRPGSYLPVCGSQNGRERMPVEPIDHLVGLEGLRAVGVIVYGDRLEVMVESVAGPRRGHRLVDRREEILNRWHANTRNGYAEGISNTINTIERRACGVCRLHRPPAPRTDRPWVRVQQHRQQQ